MLAASTEDSRRKMLPVPVLLPVSACIGVICGVLQRINDTDPLGQVECSRICRFEKGMERSPRNHDQRSASTALAAVSSANVVRNGR